MILRNTRLPMDICTRNTDGSVWTKPGISEGSRPKNPVHETHPNTAAEVVTDRVLRVTRLCYVTLDHTHPPYQIHTTTTNQPPKKKATANATAAWLVNNLGLLNTSGGVVG